MKIHLIAPVVIVIAIGISAWLLLLRRQARAWVPAELAGATVAFYEKSFRTKQPYSIVGKVDRVYRLENGLHVPTDFKSHGARVYDTDVAQLALYAWILRQLGYPTTPYGYIFVGVPGSRQRRALRVDIGSDDFAVGLIRHHEALIAGRVSPRKCRVVAKCKTCGHKSRCH